MFTQGTHADIKSSLNAIGAAVAMFELDEDDRFILVSANDTFAQAFELDVSAVSASGWAKCSPVTSLVA